MSKTTTITTTTISKLSVVLALQMLRNELNLSNSEAVTGWDLDQALKRTIARLEET